MKNQTKIYLIILLIATFCGFWGIPELVKMSTHSPQKYPFVYYSSQLKELCFIDYSDKAYPMRDMSGNRYTLEQSDSLLPLFNYRQLMADGRMPASIEGYEMTMPLLRSKTVVKRISPEVFDTPEPGLYIMYEAMPKRVAKETPKDVFRFTDRIEFIDLASNGIDRKKSDAFQQELLKRGFAFPAQWIAGNMNPIKAYDEGYFSLDARGQLFHLKMVNGRPYVRDTHIGKTMEVHYFTMMEVGDKRFYGFLFDKSGHVSILEAGEGDYRVVQLDIEPMDIRNDELLVMGNLLYWTVSVTKPDGKEVYALKTETMERLAQHTLWGTPDNWARVSEWLFPLYITIKQHNSGYIYPVFHFTGFRAFIINLVVALLAFAAMKNNKRRVLNSAFVFFTGVVGLAAFVLLPASLKRKQTEKQTSIPTRIKN